MGHGDDAGLRVPPRVAPIQAVVLLVKAEGGAGEAAIALADELRAAGVRVHLDDRVDTTFGRRAVDWELKGVPVRLEVGPRDIAEGNVVVARRDTGEKVTVGLRGAAGAVEATLEQVQATLLEEATTRRDDRTVDVATVDEAADAAQTGFAVRRGTRSAPKASCASVRRVRRSGACACPTAACPLPATTVLALLSVVRTDVCDLRPVAPPQVGVHDADRGYVMIRTILQVMGAWCLVSVPASLFVGRLIAHGQQPHLQPATVDLRQPRRLTAA